MKKLLVLIIVLTALTGCSDSQGGHDIPVSATLRELQYFAVYDVSRPEYHIEQYQYFVFTREQKVLDCGIAYKYPQFAYPDISRWSGFVKLSMYHFGAGGDTCRYYDIDKGLVSDWFWYSVGECTELIACVDMPASAQNLIVKSIFDDSYYREFPMSFLQGWGEVLSMRQQTPVICAEFTEDAKQLHVTYEDEDGNKRTQTLDLY